MEHIVKKYTKIDLHIHTSASKKDGAIVANNTIENIEKILIPKLLENEVDMVALTDHNTFSIEHYNKLKSFENNGLKKVLPGVEFDVKKHKHRFHVVVIFDDSFELEITKIQTVINKFNKCFVDGAFAFTDFVKILDEIKIPCVTIAHQKSDPKQGDHNQDLSGVGYDNFKEELYIDYFESLEFASLDTEGFLKLRKVEDNLDNLRYITGSDCHDWNNYPSNTTNFQYTYIKSLPSFMGLVMALTEFNRVSLDGGSLNSPILENITYYKNNKEKKIELSSGINVIIGDNSVGKSAILEQLFNKNIHKYHQQYLKEKNVKFDFQNELENKFLYNEQGEIRKKFEKNGSKLEDDKVIKKLFNDINTENYIKKIDLNVRSFIEYLKYNDDIHELKNSLDITLNVPMQEASLCYPSFNKVDINYDINKINTKIAKINIILLTVGELIEIEEDKELIKKFKKIRDDLNSIRKSYNYMKRDYKIKNLIIASINQCVQSMEEKTSRLKSDAAQAIEKFESESQTLLINLNSYLKELKSNKQLPIFDTVNQPIDPSVYGNYKFYTSILKNQFSQKDFETMILYLVDNTKIKKYEDLNNLGFMQLPLNGFNEKQVISKEDYFIEKCDSYIKNNITAKQIYIQKNNDPIKSKGYSAGKNALIYLDIIKNCNNINLLVFDQPEDDVSQNKISNELIDILNLARRKKQIIFITHNPQLVVNLDADNVIIVEQDDNLNLDINYGALEYEKNDFKILEKVAEMLDGGKEVLRKRWRRYGKQK